MVDHDDCWREDFHRYLLLFVHCSDHVCPQHNAVQYDVWGSLARDFLPIMASSVSSERIFRSSVVKAATHHARLDADLFEAVSFLRCVYHPELLFREEFSAECEIKELERNIGVRGAKRF